MIDCTRRKVGCGTCKNINKEACPLRSVMDSEARIDLFTSVDVRCSKYDGFEQITWWVVETEEQNTYFTSRDKARAFIKEKGANNVIRFFKTEGFYF